jgi:multicomponent Na+:H+ antiporter subunit F
MNSWFANPWIVASVITGGCLAPCAWMCLQGSPEKRLVGLEMTGVILTILLVLLTIGYGRLPFMDLPLTLAILTFGSGLVFARFLEKHL